MSRPAGYISLGGVTMPERLSENAFGKGLAAVDRRHFMEALAYFEAAMELRRRAGDLPPMKCLSYYGLSLAMVSDRLPEATEICQGAVNGEAWNPDLYRNLGRVYLKTGDRAQAFTTFVRGLQIDRRHRGLLEEIHGLGFRRRPLLRFLSRRHPLNRFLGRVRARVTRENPVGRGRSGAFRSA